MVLIVLPDENAPHAIADSRISALMVVNEAPSRVDGPRVYKLVGECGENKERITLASSAHFDEQLGDTLGSYDLPRWAGDVFNALLERFAKAKPGSAIRMRDVIDAVALVSAKP